MTRLRPAPPALLPLCVAIGIGAAVLLAGCSAGSPSPGATAGRTRSATPTATTTPTATSTPSAAAGSASGSATGTGTEGATSGTGTSSGGTGATGSSGTGGGTGTSAGTGTTVDLSALDTQAIAASGGGTVVQANGSGDSWTVLVAESDGSQILSVVSASTMRVTSGPFPKPVDAATQASTLARIASLDVDAARAATIGLGAVSGSALRSVLLAGTAADPQWTVAVTVGTQSRSVVVDGRSGSVVSTD